MNLQRGFGLGQHVRVETKMQSITDFIGKEALDLTVQGVDAEKRKLCWRRIKSVEDAERVPMYELTTTRGNTLIAAPTTKVFCPHGYVELQSLKEQTDKVFVVLNGEIVRSKIMSVTPIGDQKAARVHMAVPGEIIAVNGVFVQPD